MSKVIHFLFGKSPEIFDKSGRVRHNLPKDKWEAWNRRYMAGAEYNWHNHHGMKAEASSHPDKDKNKNQ